MHTYPLIRTRWSNEHVMAALFAVLLLYLLPLWLEKSSDIIDFLAVLGFSLILDTISGYMKYKRVVCSVSAAVTAGILHIITPGIPLWGRLLGVFAAILLGKQLWGGTGKNTLNPAIVGYLVICIIFTERYGPIIPAVALIPGLLMSLPFLSVRPYAAIGFIAGMLAGFLTGSFSSWQIMLVNAIFFGCIVLTDPVTISPSKVLGLIGGFITAFLPLQTGNVAISFALCILIFNLISFFAADYSSLSIKHTVRNPLKLKNPFSKLDLSNSLMDLTIPRNSIAENGIDIENNPDRLASDLILDRIEKNDVYGMGGAAFPTIEKIKTVLCAETEKKYLIVNAVECDPGLIHDKWLILNRMDQIIKGIKALSLCIDFSAIYFTVKGKYKGSLPDNIQVFEVKDYYPGGYEKSLVQSVLKKNIPADVIPAKQGILVLNVQTLLSVFEAVYLNIKADSKYLTLADLRSGRACIIKTTIGTTIAEILEKSQFQGFPVFTGGGIMQAKITDDLAVIGKDTNFIALSELPKYKDSHFCSNCGKCTSNCPKGLLVNRIAELADQDKYEKAKKYKPEECINCGLCSFVCLAGKNLSAKVQDAKRKVFI